MDLMRPAPGWYRCCICFHAFQSGQLYADHDGLIWDICVPCAGSERPTLMTWPIHDHEPAYALLFYRHLNYGET